MFLPTKRPAEEQLSQDDSEEEGPALGGWAEDRRRQQLLKKHRVRQTQAKLGQRSGVQSGEAGSACCPAAKHTGSIFAWRRIHACGPTNAPPFTPMQPQAALRS